MTRFNLTFSGEILPGEEPALAKRRFGKQFNISDPQRLERFFSGQTVILRRNLDRKTAAQVYRDMRRIGLVAQLVKLAPADPAQGNSASVPPPRADRTPLTQRPATGPTLLPGRPVDGATNPPLRKRQAGEPNLYAIRAFRNTAAVRQRAHEAMRRRRSGLLLAAVGLAGALALGITHRLIPATMPLQGAAAVAADGAGGLILLTRDALLLHDRAGRGIGELSAAELGVRSLHPPLDTTPNGALLVRGLLAEAPAGPPQLLRCTLAPPGCELFAAALQERALPAFAINPIDGSLLLADAGAGQLLSVAPAGDILASAEVPLPPNPVLRLHNGLLLVNSARGPALGVFRYDSGAFAQQLDEVLLLPPDGDPGQLQIDDFLWQAGAWWISLRNTRDGSATVLRFDDAWNPLGAVDLSGARPPLQLAAWGEKVLVNDGHRKALWRFNAAGEAEVPLRSPLLTARIESSARAAAWRRLGWRGVFAGVTLLIVLGVAAAYLQHLRALVHRGARPRGAEPIDEYVDSITWIPPQAQRRTRLRRLGLAYGVLALVCCLLAAGQGADARQLAALLLALSGPAAALWLLAHQSPGAVGVLGQQLVLVDHGGTYHLGADARIQFHGHFVCIDDVTVFAGNRLLPAFSPRAWRELVVPRARAGVRIDRKSLLVKLLQCRHPLALGALIALGTSATALLMLAVPRLG